VPPSFIKQRYQREEEIRSKDERLRKIANEASFSTFRFSTRQRTAASPSHRTGQLNSLFHSSIDNSKGTLPQDSVYQDSIQQNSIWGRNKPPSKGISNQTLLAKKEG
jgi:hypothetical protein